MKLAVEFTLPWFTGLDSVILLLGLKVLPGNQSDMEHSCPVRSQDLARAALENGCFRKGHLFCLLTYTVMLEAVADIQLTDTTLQDRGRGTHSLPTDHTLLPIHQNGSSRDDG